MTEIGSGKVMKKIISRILIELETPLHCGGGEDGVFTDMPVVRDAFGWYMIPGTTIAGILRHYLCLTGADQVVAALFGWQAGDDGRGSHLSVSDACVVDFYGKVAREVEIDGGTPNFPSPAQVRDHVCIDPIIGTAVATGKFDMELVPPFTRFAFELALNTENAEDPAALEQALGSLVSAINNSSVQFGGGQTRGLGYFKTIKTDTRLFDLKTRDGFEAYLNLSRGLMFVENDGGEEFTIHGEPTSNTEEIMLPLVSAGPLLIGGGNSEEADITFTTLSIPHYDADPEKSGFKNIKIIPAASIKGVIRSKIYKILGYLGHSNTDEVLDSMFGYVKSGGQIGKIRIPDIVLGEDAETAIVQHVAIDRLTGGALDGALYSEAPVWVENLAIDIKVRYSGLGDLELALLIHALMDLAEGDLAIGAGGNRGNGRFRLREDENSLKSIFALTEEKLKKLDKELAAVGGK
jgi:CRISPR/Cas system CSM-associated protein Csm3 (group 7 of RAMP superfamily)